MNQISTFLTLFLLCLTSNSFVNAQTVGFYAPYEDMENECKNSNLYAGRTHQNAFASKSFDR